MPLSPERRRADRKKKREKVGYTPTEARKRSTALKKKAFLLALEVERGHVTKACEAAGICRSTLADWELDDAEFSQARCNVKLKIIEDLEEELIRRGKNGVKKPVFQGGKLVGHVQEYSDLCLLASLRALCPERYARPEVGYISQDGPQLHIHGDSALQLQQARDFVAKLRGQSVEALPEPEPQTIDVAATAKTESES